MSSGGGVDDCFREYGRQLAGFDGPGDVLHGRHLVRGARCSIVPALIYLVQTIEPIVRFGYG
jgi:hypothetical protein